MLYPDMNLQKRTQQNTTRYRTALYLRLSREDGDKTESDSIANQRTLLEAYAADHPELCIVDEFVDDGYSGSNFERPAFQRLFQELEQGTVNCILVKDLSRFGRNYIEVGRYLERIFPVMRVRLIAVTDNYDSQSAWKTSDSIMVPMRNLLNDAYCRDISVKIKSQLAVKRKRGDFVGSFATYGYRKDPTNHSKLIVDELAAETVQDIFRWKISGMNNQSIADRLNAKKVPSPAARKLQSGAKLSLHFRKSDEPPWSAKAVDRILHNEVYIGKLVQGKTRRLDYRSKKKMNVPMSDWVIVDNTHEAIIDVDTWARVQELRKNKRRPTRTGKTNMFSGIVRCADCGEKLYYCTSRNFEARQDHFVCSTSRLKGKEVCATHFIRAVVLEQGVLAHMRMTIACVANHEEQFRKAMGAKQKAEAKRELAAKRRQLTQAERRIEELDRLFKRIYEDNVGGKLSDSRFQMLSDDYEQEQKELREKLLRLNEEITKQEEQAENIDRFISKVRKYLDLDELTPAILNDMVKAVYVHAPDKSKGYREQQIDISYDLVGILPASLLINLQNGETA